MEIPEIRLPVAAGGIMAQAARAGHRPRPPASAVLLQWLLVSADTA